jgi:Transcriptional regulator, AbiEi antitoxin
MDTQSLQPSVNRVLSLAARQHGVVTRAQLLELGTDAQAIKHRVRKGRLHSVHRASMPSEGRSSRDLAPSLLQFSAAGPTRR